MFSKASPGTVMFGRFDPARLGRRFFHRRGESSKSKCDLTILITFGRTEALGNQLCVRTLLTQVPQRAAGLQYAGQYVMLASSSGGLPVSTRVAAVLHLNQGLIAANYKGMLRYTRTMDGVMAIDHLNWATTTA
jgi:hypothetical protein